MRRLTIKGDLSASEDVIVDFAVEGAIEVHGYHLTIAEGGVVNAVVDAATVIVHGRLDGHISAGHVELAPSAVVNASIVSPRLAVHEGAQVTGAVNTDRAQA